MTDGDLYGKWLFGRVCVEARRFGGRHGGGAGKTHDCRERCNRWMQVSLVGEAWRERGGRGREVKRGERERDRRVLFLLLFTTLKIRAERTRRIMYMPANVPVGRVRGGCVCGVVY